MKRLSKTVGTLGLLGFAVIASPFAVADDSGWYMGGNIGQSKATIDDLRIAGSLAGFTSTSINDDNRDTGYKLFGGYKLNKNFALEGGYFNLGKFGFTATTVLPAGTLSGNIKLDGLNLDAVGILPITEKFSMFGRIGINYAEAKDNFTTTGSVPVQANLNPSRKQLNHKVGLGLQYNFTESLGMRAEAERYRVNDAVGNKGDIDLFSIGLVYRFGVEKPAPAPIAKVAALEPVAAPPEQITAAAPVPIIVKTQQYCSILDIQFEIKQDEIQREEIEKLKVVGTFMNKYPDTTAVIEGHTDNVGTYEFNMKLSQRRAESVVSFLEEDFHIAPARLKAMGYGETRPVADNSTMEGKQANRRIDAVIVCATDIEGLKVAPARLTMSMEIEFDPYNNEVDPKYYDELGKVANFLNANPTVTVYVEGHADMFVGKQRVTPKLAMGVSTHRAESVVNYLADKLGIPRSRLTAEGFGQTRRVAYDTTLEGQQENRRVNIIFNYVK
jgi:OOP family OmpA-OmpF porin